MAVADATAGEAAQAGFLDRERIIARPGFNRWLVPPAALAIHLCIGMAYGFSVFWLPLSKALPATDPSCSSLTLMGALFTTECNWRVADLGWIYTLFFVLLGLFALLFGVDVCRSPWTCSTFVFFPSLVLIFPPASRAPPWSTTCSSSRSA